MDAGQLRQRVTIRRLVDTPDGEGGFDRDWTTLADRISAKVTNLNGREALIGGALQAVATFEILVRYRGDIQTRDQVLYDGRELNVLTAEDRKGLRKWLTIVASTEAPQGA